MVADMIKRNSRSLIPQLICRIRQAESIPSFPLPFRGIHTIEAASKHVRLTRTVGKKSSDQLNSCRTISIESQLNIHLDSKLSRPKPKCLFNRFPNHCSICWCTFGTGCGRWKTMRPAWLWNATAEPPAWVALKPALAIAETRLDHSMSLPAASWEEAGNILVII